MTDFERVASLTDIPPGKGCAVTVGERLLALFNVDGTLHAIDNTCCHQGGPLGEGSLAGQIVTCPWHGWEYDVTTGACCNVDGIQVKHHAVKVEGDDVLVGP